MSQGAVSAGLVAILAAAPLWAQDSRITPERGSFQFMLNNSTISITRQGAACPPACVQPMQAAPGVGTIGELEVMDFLDLFVSAGKGLLLDTRLPQGYADSTIPGAVNVPAATLGPQNPYRDDLLTALGVVSGNYSAAYDLVIFGTGSDDPNATIAVRSLIEAGYPANKVKYFRGGINSWQALGLSTAAGQ